MTHLRRVARVVKHPQFPMCAGFLGNTILLLTLVSAMSGHHIIT